PRLLHLLAPVAAVPPGMAVLDARGRDDPGRDRARPVGWDPAAGADVRRQGHARGPGAPLRAVGADHAREGVGLLPGAVRPADVTPGCGRGSLVHRRPRPAPRPQLPDDRRG